MGRRRLGARGRRGREGAEFEGGREGRPLGLWWRSRLWIRSLPSADHPLGYGWVDGHSDALCEV